MRRRAFLVWCLSSYLFASLATQAAAEPIAIIVNTANMRTTLNKSYLHRIYSGKITQWEDGQKVVALNYPIHAEIRRRFYVLVLEAEPAAKFFIPGSPIPFKLRQMRSDRAVRKMVAGVPGAIGYLPLSAVDDSVKILSIDGMRPSQANYPLQ